jgi:hypothetical protein
MTLEFVSFTDSYPTNRRSNGELSSAMQLTETATLWPHVMVRILGVSFPSFL